MSSAVESPVETPVETNVIAIVERLRKLADVCERHEIDLSYALVDGRKAAEKPVAIYEVDFVRLFKDQEVAGLRRGPNIDVEASIDGVAFSATLYRPVKPSDEPTVVVV